MNTVLSLGAVAGCLVLACMMLSRYRRLVRAEKELESVKQTNRRLESRLDQIVEVQIRLAEIQNEKAPERKNAPPRGDTAARLARLNDRVQEQ